MVEQVFWKGTQSQVNSWRQKTLGLPAIHLSSLAEANIPFLYSFSPSVVPEPYDWPDWIHTCGYWFLDNPEGANWKAPESLVKFIEAGPVIYIGFGSIIVPDPDEMTRILVEAVKQAGVRAILSKVS
jgi:sterol 3beta-glucosyltransferase